jgi:hypothetical protein
VLDNILLMFKRRCKVLVRRFGCGDTRGLGMGERRVLLLVQRDKPTIVISNRVSKLSSDNAVRN